MDVNPHRMVPVSFPTIGANGTYASDLLRYRSPLFPSTARDLSLSPLAIASAPRFSEQGVVIMLAELLAL